MADALAGSSLAIDGSAGAMVVHLEEPEGAAAGLAIVAHGRNGARAQPQMAALVEACLARSLTVLSPDLCHSAGNASAGEADCFTMAGHLADLASVMAFADARVPPGAGKARLLVGHSMGAYAACRMAAERVGDVTALLAVSPVFSGNALLAARRAMGPDAIAALKAELPGALAEWPTHDLAPVAPADTQPAAVIVGADDTVTPPADAARLAELLPRCVHHEVLPGEHHCPIGPGYKAAIDRALAALLRG